MLGDAERDRRIGERLLEDGFYNDALWLPSEEYGRDDAEAAAAKAAKAVTIAERFVKDWFAEPSGPKG
jgi:hypothetical protein